MAQNRQDPGYWVRKDNPSTIEYWATDQSAGVGGWREREIETLDQLIVSHVTIVPPSPPPPSPQHTTTLCGGTHSCRNDALRNREQGLTRDVFTRERVSHDSESHCVE